MQKTIPKVYDPHAVEEKWYQEWLEKGYFHSEPNPNKKPYCIVIPPPNVTAELHMGHAYNNTIQDIFIRYHRMAGDETLWMPGTDHAGIATQNVVERSLAREEGLTRHDLGREKFVERVWQWQRKYGSTIISQLKRLGCSCDWERERFTMDEGLSKAVIEVFVRLYERGLIYRGRYIINWCPRCQTALSDEEAVHQDHEGNLWYVRYPIKGSDKYVIVATTRPETMLGDTAVAANPSDERHRELMGKTAILPVIGRELPIIADEYVDPSFGTGLVKVTPAHDPNDYLIGQRHKLDFVNILNEDATLNENAGPYKGYDRFACREELVEQLKREGHLEKVERHTHAVAHCQRCDTILEPFLSEQWFVKAKPLAEPALRVVQEGRIKFYPERWTKVYTTWMENIRDWCISRQLWWGHRIPVYYCDDCGHMMVKRSAPEACEGCSSRNIHQDEDVLDTWFSSWLWPFSTMGWPEKTPELEYYYPTQLLATAAEIIFFWVARMIMAGLEFMGDIPFADVYINGTVRDEIGRKMSKSLGNGIDPLLMIKKYSADAVRFSLMMLASEGQDINLSESRFEMGRNFSNKIWNAYRFLALNAGDIPLDSGVQEVAELPGEELADAWIKSKYYRTVRTVTDGLNQYRLHEGISTVHNFFWHDYCDWYLELVKARVSDEASPDSKRAALQLATGIMEGSMTLLHPFMPFITEEVWQSLNCHHETGSIMVSPWPRPYDNVIDPQAEAQMQVLQDTITAIRNIRGEMSVPPGKRINAVLKVSDNKTIGLMKEYSRYLIDLARLNELTIAPTPVIPKPAARAFLPGIEVHIPLAGIIDIAAEEARLKKELSRVEAEIAANEAKLSNEKFVSRAPEHVVQSTRQKKEELLHKAEKLKHSLDQLQE
ncbi:MAG: valine--tRNA ligase [Candidatus Abyssobacteria bacterium SURF_17]|uniref:Valine--tRNA ligase n=1 Tax=Candidatus Abyssobacteria bacterium SURF_17 TaxID=2093361 RepID=A0A419F9M2_9BACT|nr:MAG: valine--tRNA ligase [Candidatus Abyssubacteria bacterium SURF_17]